MRKYLRILLAVLMIGPSALSAVAVSSAVVAPVAAAEDNGVGSTPMMGWSSWGPDGPQTSAAKDEQAARDLVSTGLAKLGYDYVNQDDFWYVCPGSQGPAVSANGFWVPNSNFPPGPNGESGIEVLAHYVHSLGLKFGIYVTPGISMQAVTQNVAILGPGGKASGYTADQIANTSFHENNYNCGGMVGLKTQPDASVPGGQILTQGAQDFLDSWANEFASWGVDYVKLDGVGSFDIADVIGWSDALRQTGRPMFLALSNSLNINYASTWKQYSNDWRTDGDIQCYCSAISHEQTSWTNVESRFNQAAAWAPYGGPGGFNWLDDIVVGDSSAMTGLTQTESETMMSLWALAASPLEIGVRLGELTKQGLADLSNRSVIAVDQDGIDAHRVAETPTSQIFAKTEQNGDVVVGLFNTSAQAETVSTTASALGLASGVTGYQLDNLWSGSSTETAGQIEASVAPHGVVLYRVTPINNPSLVPPSVALDIGGLSSALAAGHPSVVTVSFTDNGVLPVQHVDLSLSSPPGWTAMASSGTTFGGVESGQTVQATFEVVAPSPSGQLFGTGILSASASYTWHGQYQLSTSLSAVATVASPVQSPYKTYSSATDAPAVFAESGSQFGISGAGTDIYVGHDNYSTIYLPGSMALTSTAVTEVTSQTNMAGYAKAGIIVRNNMAAAGTAPEGVILFESPEGGIQMEWDNNGGEYIDTFTPSCSQCSAAPNGAIPESLPIYLMLQRDGSTYTGYFSYDGSSWLKVGSATVPDQNATQDAGMFVTSHATGQPGTVTFNGFTVKSGSTPPPMATLYMANAASRNSLTQLEPCGTCYYGEVKVGYLGEGGTLTFDNVAVEKAGTYDLTIIYGDGSAAAGSPGRPGAVSINGSTPQGLQFVATGSYTTMGALTIPVTLVAGTNTIEFGDPNAYMPDIDAIVVGAE
jgi:hypothetical protein